jgi:predicted RNase H-like nuclease (RuvC/YqgF family)
MFSFKKKQEVVDLRPRDSDMPIPSKIRERLMASGKTQVINGNSVSDSLEASVPAVTSSSSNSSSSGGFFNFFGGGDSSNNESSASASSNNRSLDLEKVDSKINDLLYRFSRLTDRVELLEKKMDRFERKESY